MRREDNGRPCVGTHAMCTCLWAEPNFLVGGVGRCLGLSVETALGFLINCFSNYYFGSVMFSSKIIVDDDGNDGDGDSLGVWMGSCCSRSKPKAHVGVSLWLLEDQPSHHHLPVLRNGPHQSITQTYVSLTFSSFQKSKCNHIFERIL